MKFVVVEIDLSNTKSYLYDKEIKELGLVTINFKNNYKKEEALAESDVNVLSFYINELKIYDCNIYVYETSIF